MLRHTTVLVVSFLLCFAASAPSVLAACDETAALMSACDARSFVKQVVRDRAGRGYSWSKLKCRRRNARSFKCRVMFFAGDTSYSGTALVGFRNEFRSDDYYDFKLTERNWYWGVSRRVRLSCWRNCMGAAGEFDV